MTTIESMYNTACDRGDTAEATRLARVMQRLDEQRAAYGRAARSLGVTTEELDAADDLRSRLLVMTPEQRRAYLKPDA